MEQVIPIGDEDLLRALFGPGDRHLRRLRQRFGVDVVLRDQGVKLVGEEAAVVEAASAVRRAIGIWRRDHQLTDEAMRRVVDDGGPVAESDAQPQPGNDGAGAPPPRALPQDGVHPRTAGQDHYVAAIRDHAITFAIGPAGTGKTYLAVAVAVSELRRGNFRKLVLCRPAVEAGERLGFLPGDIEAKVNPYLRPLYDALFALLDAQQVRKYIDHDVIEIAPLAYMRGRTLERAFIILDEAQNTTPKQMKMFLTRMGLHSRIVVTGDVTQIDLPQGQGSGLSEAVRILDGTEGIGIVRMTRSDIVRHPVVQRVVDAYDRADPRGNGGG
ncbi:MAG TPA: PhoH family protein [Planctomycetota bacterium]|jgi:phosphate starvation-inducible PhoH-like protein|nr:PhoH family protein [Planctomycetota bacterium]